MKMANTHPWIEFPSHLSPLNIRSLSLLFILEECAEKLNHLKILENSPKEELFIAIQSFVKASNNQESHAFPDKLCFYCEILLQASKVSQHSLDLRIDAMKRFMLELKLKILNSKSAAQEGFPLNEFCLDMKSLLRSFFFSLNPFLMEAKSDENVLLKLIEHKNVFNFLEPQLVEKMLHSFFPSNIAQLKAIICEGLTKRGFSFVFEESEKFIDEIQWEELCPEILS